VLAALDPDILLLCDELQELGGGILTKMEPISTFEVDYFKMQEIRKQYIKNLAICKIDKLSLLAHLPTLKPSELEVKFHPYFGHNYVILGAPFQSSDPEQSSVSSSVHQLCTMQVISQVLASASDALGGGDDLEIVIEAYDLHPEANGKIKKRPLFRQKESPSVTGFKPSSGSNSSSGNGLISCRSFEEALEVLSGMLELTSEYCSFFKVFFFQNSNLQGAAQFSVLAHTPRDEELIFEEEREGPSKNDNRGQRYLEALNSGSHTEQ